MLIRSSLFILTIAVLATVEARLIGEGGGNKVRETS